MSTHFGSEIRRLRKQKGLDLKELSNRLNVSVGYLSNLETGKTETISFSFLEKLENELHYSPLTKNIKIEKELNIRITRINKQLSLISKSKPDKVVSFLKMIEDALHLLRD